MPLDGNTEEVRFTLDGQDVSALPGESIWQVAQRLGTSIPHLCYSPEPGYRADGNCRACMVEIEGERVLAASCIRQPSEGMIVSTATDRAASARKMVFELLVSDQPSRDSAYDDDSTFCVGPTPRPITAVSCEACAGSDLSHPAMKVNLDACIN